MKDIIFTILELILFIIIYCAILIFDAYITIREEWEYKYKRILKKEEKLKQKALRKNSNIKK